MAYPTLSITPNYPLGEEFEDSTIKSDLEGGYVQTRSRFTRTRKTYALDYEYMPAADKGTLETFFGTVKCADIFTWTDPRDSSSKNVRFDKPPVFTYIDNGYWDVSFNLVEA